MIDKVETILHSKSWYKNIKRKSYLLESICIFIQMSVHSLKLLIFISETNVCIFIVIFAGVMERLGDKWLEHLARISHSGSPTYSTPKEKVGHSLSCYCIVGNFHRGLIFTRTAKVTHKSNCACKWNQAILELKVSQPMLSVLAFWVVSILYKSIYLTMISVFHFS